MIMDQKIEQIRAKCIETNPEIRKRPCVLSFNGRKEIGVPDNNGPEIRLADVLLAIHAKFPTTERFYGIDTEGEFGQFSDTEGMVAMEPLVYWDLRNDDLEKQSPETIEFLYNLLCT